MFLDADLCNNKKKNYYKTIELLSFTALLLLSTIISNNNK